MWSLNLSLQIKKVSVNTKSSLRGTVSLRGQMPKIKRERKITTSNTLHTLRSDLQIAAGCADAQC